MGTSAAKLIDFTIPAGGGAGSTIDLTGLTALEMFLPGGSTTGAITAEISHRGIDWGVFTGEDGNVWTVPGVVASTTLRFDERTFQDIKYLRFKYGNQGAPRACTLKVLPAFRVLR